MRTARSVGRTIHRLFLTALVSGALVVVVGSSAVLAKADDPTPAQLTAAGWTCILPGLVPTQQLCAPPGVGLPPFPGTPGFATRRPSYEVLVFDLATGAFLGTQHLLRPDIYENGRPPCPQQPGGQYIYNPRNDLWFCNRLGADPSS